MEGAKAMLRMGWDENNEEPEMPGVTRARSSSRFSIDKIIFGMTLEGFVIEALRNGPHSGCHRRRSRLHQALRVSYSCHELDCMREQRKKPCTLIFHRKYGFICMMNPGKHGLDYLMVGEDTIVVLTVAVVQFYDDSG